MDQGPYREASPLDPRVERRRAELCGPLANAVTRMGIIFGAVLTATLGAVAFALSELRLNAPVLAFGAIFALVPSLAIASVLRARRIALRFMRDSTPLLSYFDDGGLVLLSPEGLSREGKAHVAFTPRVGRDGALARVVHDAEKHSLTMVVLWKPPQKGKSMEEREHCITLPPSISPTQAASAGERLAALRGCAFTTS